MGEREGLEKGLLVQLVVKDDAAFDLVIFYLAHRAHL